MAEATKKQGYIKKETLYFSVIIVFVLGYIAGVVTTVYNSTNTPNSPQKPATAPANPG